MKGNWSPQAQVGDIRISLEHNIQIPNVGGVQGVPYQLITEITISAVGYPMAGSTAK